MSQHLLVEVLRSLYVRSSIFQVLDWGNRAALVHVENM